MRKALPSEFGYIIDELLHADFEGENESLYYSKILESILALEDADAFIVALSGLIKRLAVDHLHIVGDIFDRGPRPDLIMDMLMEHHAVDIQWGNHDILYMGAACGSESCIAIVVNNCLATGNLAVLEQGYGINLRPLALFAEKTYPRSHCFEPKRTADNAGDTQNDIELAGRIRKAIAVILFKLEGQIIRRHPEYEMEGRLLLDKINFSNGTVRIDDADYTLRDTLLPTLSDNVYELSDDEAEVMAGLKQSFLQSERLKTHVRFLYTHGSMYKVFNQNLMFHGCIPMTDDGAFASVNLGGRMYSGKALMDACDAMARAAFFGKGDERRNAADGMWYLWCGRLSPLFGRERMTTFERMFVADRTAWTEKKNAYYEYAHSEMCCEMILREFGLVASISHIINGHVPVKAASGELPVKGGGKLIVIDGGFCKAYQPTTGIAGYTLIYNSWGMRLSAHRPFTSVKDAIENDLDIHSTTDIFEKLSDRVKVLDTDIGQDISDKIFDLSLLLRGYRGGH